MSLGESVALRDVVDAAADGRTLVLRKRDQREARRFLGFGIDASVVVKEPNDLILVVNDFFRFRKFQEHFR